MPAFDRAEQVRLREAADETADPDVPDIPAHQIVRDVLRLILLQTQVRHGGAFTIKGGFQDVILDPQPGLFHALRGQHPVSRRLEGLVRLDFQAIDLAHNDPVILRAQPRENSRHERLTIQRWRDV